MTICFSLPTQRCFLSAEVLGLLAHLFSAYAEVFLPLNRLRSLTSAFLCLRRGVSTLVRCFILDGRFSLPTQRCFCGKDICPDRRLLFSAYAEVFPIQRSERSCSTTFLCLRRGVSADRAKESCRAPFSLPTQRCFRPSPPSVHSACLFSAYAEVFRPDLPQAPDPQAFLCLRRGVSHRRHRLCRFIAFSLPTQRCFRIESDLFGAVYLFSAYAEVFL